MLVLCLGCLGLDGDAVRGRKRVACGGDGDFVLEEPGSVISDAC